jgi:TolA-binding protein
MHVCVLPGPAASHRAKKLHEDRQTEMQQTLSQMNDRTEELDCVAEQKEAAVKAKQQAEDKLEVGGTKYII